MRWLIVFCLFFAVKAHGADDYPWIGEITTDKVRMRAGFSTNEKTMGTLDKGTPVEVVGAEVGWVQILAPVGVKAWVHLDLTNYLSAKIYREGQPIAVTAEKVHCRAGPGTEFPSLCLLEEGEKLSFILVKDQWAQVMAPAYARVWVSEQFVKPSSQDMPPNTRDYLFGEDKPSIRDYLFGEDKDEREAPQSQDRIPVIKHDGHSDAQTGSVAVVAEPIQELSQEEVDARVKPISLVQALGARYETLALQVLTELSQPRTRQDLRPLIRELRILKHEVDGNLSEESKNLELNVESSSILFSDLSVLVQTDLEELVKADDRNRRLQEPVPTQSQAVANYEELLRRHAEDRERIRRNLAERINELTLARGYVAEGWLMSRPPAMRAASGARARIASHQLEQGGEIVALLLSGKDEEGRLIFEDLDRFYGKYVKVDGEVIPQGKNPPLVVVFKIVPLERQP